MTPTDVVGWLVTAYSIGLAIGVGVLISRGRPPS